MSEYENDLLAECLGKLTDGSMSFNQHFQRVIVALEYAFKNYDTHIEIVENIYQLGFSTLPLEKKKILFETFMEYVPKQPSCNLNRYMQQYCKAVYFGYKGNKKVSFATRLELGYYSLPSAARGLEGFRWWIASPVLFVWSLLRKVDYFEVVQATLRELITRRDPKESGPHGGEDPCNQEMPKVYSIDRGSMTSVLEANQTLENSRTIESTGNSSVISNFSSTLFPSSQVHPGRVCDDTSEVVPYRLLK